MTAFEPIEFSDREISLVVSSLPDTADPRRCELLPQILRDWGQLIPYRLIDLEPRALQAERRRRFKKIEKAANRLLQMIEGLELRERWEVETLLSRLEGKTSVFEFSFWDEHRVNASRKTILTLIAAIQGIWVPNKGHPIRHNARLIMFDLAYFYEYFTSSRAERVVDRSSGQETGPFYKFAAALWPVIFESGDDGLPAAVKNWASARKGFDESHSVVSIIAARHPEWGVFA